MRCSFALTRVPNRVRLHHYTSLFQLSSVKSLTVSLGPRQRKQEQNYQTKCYLNLTVCLFPRKHLEVTNIIAKMSSGLPQRVPSTSPFYQVYDVLESDVEPDVDPPRGRKRRRSSAASLPAQQMSTLRGRGRHRSLSTNQEVSETLDQGQEGSKGSKSSSGVSRNEGEIRNISVLREVITVVEVYYQQRQLSPNMELSRVLQKANNAVATAETKSQYQFGNQLSTDVNSNLEAQTTDNGPFFAAEARLALLEGLREHENIPELKSAIARLQKINTSAKKLITPNRPVMNDRPHTKKRRSQSPSRSRSNDKLRRRQRTRSRSRSHGLGKNSHV
ncbi:hypothetical protein BJ875DRAFT_258589 [Amylocarpus encephaloides]|uniref:Uncharacterized protein n=1 Tax=Amylocarpus encephaloides TaxID=45428 RepID=A0A9P7YL78_9HELO|nr:hypothetical protein BJ875DRAFT_258589 [Amylocarpus encephaloides]